MPRRIAIASACLHLGAAIYVLLGLIAVALSYTPAYSDEIPVVLGRIVLAFSVGIAVGFEAVAWGLRRSRFWAWVAGLCIFALFVPSPFLPLGVVGLWAILSPGTRTSFGINVGPGDLPANPPEVPSKSVGSGAKALIRKLLVLVLTMMAVVVGLLAYTFVGTSSRAHPRVAQARFLSFIRDGYDASDSGEITRAFMESFRKGDLASNYTAILATAEALPYPEEVKNLVDNETKYCWFIPIPSAAGSEDASVRRLEVITRGDPPEVREIGYADLGD